MANKELKVGDVLAAKYTYGDEVLLWDFWYVMKTTATMVEICKLKSKTVYDDGLEGPHYYDDPYHLQPALVQDKDGNWCYMLEGKVIRRKVKYNSAGEPVVVPEEFWRSCGVWDGRPLSGYNLH